VVFPNKLKNKSNLKKSYVTILAALVLPFLEQNSFGSKSKDLNPYHEDWSCQITDNDSYTPGSPSKKWLCTRGDFNNKKTVFNPKVSSSKRQQLLSEALGWIPDTSDTANTCNTCNGKYYQYPFATKDTPLDKSLSTVKFSKFSEDIKRHELHYQGNVEIVQPSRVLYTDDATIFYAPETQKPSTITAKGNVKLLQPGEMILADDGVAHLSSHQGKVNNAIYLFSVPSNWSLKEQFNDKNFTGFAHGKADRIIQTDKYKYILDNATYTTCPPTKHTWELSAKKIDLNKKTSRGVSKHTVMRVLGVPVFYFPYFSFPLGDKRQSGFLYPSIMYGSHNGISLGVPYYFNLAPNYDDTLTPIFYQRRGVMAYNQFRLLTQKSYWVNNIYYLPRDARTHTDRYFGDLTAKYKFNTNWSSDLLYQTVSDQDYFTDFDNSSPENANVLFLERKADLTFHNPNWNLNALISNYKIVNQELDIGNAPYNRLPDISLAYDSISNWHGLSFNINNDFTYFQKDSRQNQSPSVEGMRTYVIPDLKWQLDKSYAFMEQDIRGFARSYQDLKYPSSTSGKPKSTNTIIPQYQLISGLNFTKDFIFSKSKYQQTLTPKIGYLYTPYRDQNALPIFDSSVIGFSYDQLFSNRSFSGYDRIQNSNKVAYALATSITNEDQPVLDFGVGQIYYLNNRRVGICDTSAASCLTSEIPNIKQKFSDVADKLTYHISPQWQFSLNNTYDVNFNKLDSLSYILQYNKDPRHLANIEYSINRYDYGSLSNEQILSGIKPPRNSQIIGSFIWQLTPPWHLLGRWNYSLSKQKSIDMFAGISYDSCCWVSSFGFRRFRDSIDEPNNPNGYSGRLNTSFMVQFELKGLGSLSSTQFSDMTSKVPGYKPYESGFR
jgi:LPS-assembly protein